MAKKRYDIYCGIDVGKSAHHAVALTADGRRNLGRELPQDETMLRALFDELVAQGSVMMVVDQPRNIGALSIAVARDAGINVAYLPGLRMLAAFDADLAVEENRISGRIRSVLLSVHPALERAIGKHLYRSVALTLLAEFGGPVRFAAASRRRYDGLRNAPPRATATRQPRRCSLPWASRR